MTDFSRLEKFVLLSMKATFPKECKEVQSDIIEDTLIKLEKCGLVVLGKYTGATLTRKGLEAALDIEHAQRATPAPVRMVDMKEKDELQMIDKKLIPIGIIENDPETLREILGEGEANALIAEHEAEKLKKAKNLHKREKND